MKELFIMLTIINTGGNLLPNGDFRDGLWQPYYGNLPHGAGNVQLVKQDGGYVTRIETFGDGGVSSDGGGMSETFTVTGGTAYQLQLTVQGQFNPRLVARYGVDFYDALGTRLAREDDTYSHAASLPTKLTLGMTAPLDATSARAYFHTWQDGRSCGYVYFSNFNFSFKATGND